MKRIFLILCVYLSSSLIAQNQIFEGSKAAKYFKNADLLRIEKGTNSPSYVRFVENSEPLENNFFRTIKSELAIPEGYSFILKTSSTDHLGITHSRYKQYYNNVEVAYSNLMIHVKNGKVLSFNGVYQTDAPQSIELNLSEEQALSNALNYVNANQYRWELNSPTNPKLSEDYPKGKLIYLPDLDDVGHGLILTYRFNIYATDPLSRQHIFVNGKNGIVQFNESLIHTGGDSHGQAATAYSDTQDIVADSMPNYFQLRDSTRGNGVETYNCQRTKNFSAAVDFIDSNNFWNNVNANMDQHATDAHWGTELTYDYLLNKHSRNSIDDRGFTLKSYVHYDQSLVNAFWDGQRMSYGDGDGVRSPLTALDIVAHEITHGLTDSTSDLIYRKESGALNESFSDIFGTAVEFYARPGRSNWILGEDIGGAFRSLEDPEASPFNDPDTYGGTNWISQNCTAIRGNDWCGVHTNSGVQNHWFYILSIGASDTNSVGSIYNVTGQGMQKAEKIAYRNLTIYLSPTSDYDDARFFSIISAIDLYGACSPEVEATTNAWYAVGVGNPYQNIVSASFDVLEDTVFCSVPAVVKFRSGGINVKNYYWDFGNGDTSTTRDPSVTYTTQGVYTIQLIGDGLTCGSDTVTKVNYIRVDSTVGCSEVLRDTINPILTDCKGRLYDSGGFGGDYGPDERGTVTIHVASADYIELNFAKLAVESGLVFNCNRDYVEVFDGASVNDPSLGRYCSNYMPVGNKVTSSSNYLSIRFHSDNIIHDAGFQLDWECKNAASAPIADFSANTDSSCSGVVSFKNLSSEGSSNMLWEFGDGNVSSEVNPVHEYKANGTFNVSLTVQNSILSDSIIKNSFVVVNRPIAPMVSNDTFCIGMNAGLKVFTTENIKWYRDTTDNFVQSGDSITLFNLRRDSILYIQETTNQPIVSGGAAPSTTGGLYSDDNDYIEFDVHKRIMLHTFIFFSNRAGNRTLDLRNHKGEIVKSKEIYIPASPLRVNINMEIDPDTSYRLSISDRDVSLFKRTSGVVFPYNISNLVSLKGANNAGEYPYFFQWRVSELSCISPFREIRASIDSTCALVGLNENASVQGEVYISPNPFNNTLSIDLNELESEKGVRIKLFSSNGTLVFEKLYRDFGTKLELELDFLQTGIYYINLVGDKTNFRKKVIKVE